MQLYTAHVLRVLLLRKSIVVLQIRSEGTMFYTSFMPLTGGILRDKSP